MFAMIKRMFVQQEINDSLEELDLPLSRPIENFTDVSKDKGMVEPLHFKGYFDEYEIQ